MIGAGNPASGTIASVGFILGGLGGRIPTSKDLDPPIDPPWWMYLHFGLLCSNQWSTTGPSKVVVCVVLSQCLWESAYERSLVAYRKE